MYIPHQPCLKAVLVFRGETFCTFKRKQLQRGFPTFFKCSCTAVLSIILWHCIFHNQQWALSLTYTLKIDTLALITIRRYVHCSWQTFCSSLWRCSCCFTACLMLCMKSILPLFSFRLKNSMFTSDRCFLFTKISVEEQECKKSNKNTFKAKCRSCFEANHL